MKTTILSILLSLLSITSVMCQTSNDSIAKPKLKSLSFYADSIKLTDVQRLEIIENSLAKFAIKNRKAILLQVLGGAMLGIYAITLSSGKPANALPYLGTGFIGYGTIIHINSFEYLYSHKIKNPNKTKNF